jgi:hypothetical protein
MRLRFLRLTAALALAAGCAWDRPPVEWESPTPLATSADTAARYRATWTSGAAPEVVIQQPEDARRAASSTAAPLASVCPGSWVDAVGADGQVWSAWWQIRPDSSSRLMTQERDAAGRVQRTFTVDSVDKAFLGCARPSPSITVDRVNGHVHVGYYMVAPEGPGLFYAHVMAPQYAAFEPPMPIVYGEKPVRVAVASRGDTVALAYEDPNSEMGRIAMSMSLTSGHLFEQTARIVRVSTSSQEASQPQIVRLADGQLWLGWTETSQSGNAFLLRRARIVTR